LHEDEHLLVVLKPAGVNTHAPSPYAGEGLYDWLRHREPRWARLAIIHRLDKETSGLLVFAKTDRANRSLTEQFARRQVRKSYVLLTDHAVPQGRCVVKSNIVRGGDRYLAVDSSSEGQPAETRFRVLGLSGDGHTLVEAEPVTGRTHQIRVHAAARGFPVLGDTVYGGTGHPRVCLHAREIMLRHPADGATVTFTAPADFAADARLALRRAFIALPETDAFRLIHGASDGWPGWYVDRLGEWLLSQSGPPLSPTQLGRLRQLCVEHSARGAYHKLLARERSARLPAQASPRLVIGAAAPERFAVHENGLRFELSFQEGYSVGLFLDQRDNRRRLLTGHIAAGFINAECGMRNGEFRRSRLASAAADPAGEQVDDPGEARFGPTSDLLNVFAYTCGFSVAAAKAGSRTTSLDLSKKYLDWGRRHFALNGLDPAAHDFIYGEAFGWLRRLAKKGRAFDVIVLDPPTFSQSKEHGVFRAEKDYQRLVAAALPLLRPNGVLFASTNAAELKPERFISEVHAAIQAAGRAVQQEHYVPQPPDFPVSREEPAYLKTVWLRLA
jgi:23S rRNA (cytosine1962-C5)-methyltransferase